MHADWLHGKLLDHGALLWRGFDIASAADFEDVISTVAPDLGEEYLGTTPRNRMGGRVHTSTELAGWYLIPQHIEMSFLPSTPRQLFFACLYPSHTGGQTPLADFRRVWADLDDDVRERFRQGGIRNVRNYDGPGSPRRFDPWKTKRWDAMFETTDRAEVERKAAEAGLRAEWRANDRLRLVNEQEAFRVHPETGTEFWCNHLQVFHMSTGTGEYRRLFERNGSPLAWALSHVARTVTAVRERITDPDDLPTHCTYRDGSPIPQADIDHVRDTIWRHLVTFDWQRGDMLAIDNFAVSHGRMPFRGKRQIGVAWA